MENIGYYNGKKLADEYNLPLIELKQKDFSKEFDLLIEN